MSTYVYICPVSTKEHFNLTTHSTHSYLRLYCVEDMVKDHSVRCKIRIRFLGL